MEKINLKDREYPLPNIHCEPIILKNETGQKTHTIGEITKVKDKTIIGLFFPLQNKDVALQRSFEGLPLLNRNASGSAYIDVKNNTGEQLTNVPLEFYGHEIEIHDPGKYAQALSPGERPNYKNSYDLKQSKVKYDASKIVGTDGEVLLLGIVYLDPTVCSSPKICS